MAGKNRGKLGIGLPDPDLSKNQGGLPDLDLDPTRFLSRYYPPRDISPIIHITDMGEEDQGGLPDLDPKSRSGFFNLPNLSRHFGISQDGHPDLLKSSR